METIKDKTAKDISEINRETIRNFMDKRGLKILPWCKKAGLSESTLRNFLNGDSETLTGTSLSKLSKAENIAFNLVDGLLIIGEDNINYDLNSAKIKGYVQAGAWGEAYEFPEEDQEVMPVPVNFPYKNIFGLIVKGDSMNQEYKEGEQLLCVKLEEYGEENIKAGDNIIVRAICFSGDIETTVKEFWIDEFGHKWLVPKSDNPKYQRYPVPNSDTIDVQINGKRIKSIMMDAFVYSSTRIR